MHSDAVNRENHCVDGTLAPQLNGWFDFISPTSETSGHEPPVEGTARAGNGLDARAAGRAVAIAV
ncbi:hypothetical protein [Haloarcula laminariae]|uniref:hypothetical protein n=1 Tax=Haloarcula laminariae TaxID=2961577 RepID=UPI0021C894BE|nr:hypothetical protein [Halomicroarcula laminariae]